MAARSVLFMCLLLLSGAVSGSEGTGSQPAVEQSRLLFRFEAHSSRLLPDQAERFAQLGRILRDLPDATAIILVPSRQAAPARRFVAARIAELQRQAQMIGVAALTQRDQDGGSADDILVIKIEAPGPASPPEPPPEQSPTPPKVWQADAGRSLRELLNGWAEQAGWMVVWQSAFDYPLEASASFKGDFADVVDQAMRGFVDAKPPPSARVHRANRVVVVE